MIGCLSSQKSRDIFYMYLFLKNLVFVQSLRFSLQKKLYRHRIIWKHLEGLFIFLPLEDSDNIRMETWVGQRKATRTVFERKYKRNESDKVLSTKHFAFSVSFLLIGEGWYMSVTPDWFFSYGDQYEQSKFGDKLISGLKRMEKNRSVFDQFRFLCSWLKELDSEDLFSNETMSSPQITFGHILQYGGGRYLNEDLWESLILADEDDSEQRKLGFQ